MAQATRSEKQKKAPLVQKPTRKAEPKPLVTKPTSYSEPLPLITRQKPREPLPQAVMNLPKKMKGFSRYDFYPDGRVVNVATGSDLVAVQLLERGFGFRLTADSGKREWLYRADLEALFAPDKEQPQVPPQDGRKTYYTRKTDKKSYKRLTKPQIDAILKLKEPKQVELAREYGVSESTISRLLNQKTRLKSYYA